ncbi:MAG: ATP-binding protein [Kordiimonadaceae bacterium]|nr:ATP-binding protein [Kordiimonadaceae bacterium]MBO6570607.1 ATP-binding protein [Kordiimonadaceae bacterium]MBO6966535.1 ATP-binding protein [Kordiimonadaceae bacterium]
MTDKNKQSFEEQIARLTRAVDALADAIKPGANAGGKLPNTGNAFVFDADACALQPVAHVSAPPLSLLIGIDRVKDSLLENSERFANGFSANNALLWGARGMGKSTLVKAVHRYLVENIEQAPALVEIHREDIAALPKLLTLLRGAERRFILYCDDLSFNRPDQDFKALKSVLEGGLEGRPSNVIFYATSNRRHMLPRQMIDQEGATGIHPNEAMDETIALSDRFGLWLGFHPCDQAEYLAIIEGYLAEFGLNTAEDWQPAALEWAKTRGNRSGRTAWQFVQNLAGELGQFVKF